MPTGCKSVTTKYYKTVKFENKNKYNAGNNFKNTVLLLINNLGQGYKLAKLNFLLNLTLFWFITKFKINSKVQYTFIFL